MEERKTDNLEATGSSPVVPKNFFIEIKEIKNERIRWCIVVY